ncbi:cold-induced protein [Thecamonas trahens ATCC 50062]|uniref:Cold-induced protein n=1 Tax=Thecamonas trahens ATCC 50062 TaxID=461836 RepID=A0A0L0DDK7_THETB|nr:cold-induced protein [Thecamonas trahens ATCC 50062]KNC50432.1 cold-induced protein [Thecamonas trahens ATCC 50062]|eukprot:XP_013756972.1 cold-induced protein [Thecamonas trahens ATCC 50062]
MSKRGHGDGESALDHLEDVTSLVAALRSTVEGLVASAKAGQIVDETALAAGSHTLMRLRGAHRGVMKANAEKEAELAEASTALDEAQLGLESVLYEKAVVLNEIKRCAEFAFAGDALDLVPAKDALADAAVDAKSLSDHEVMLARLTFEMAQREKLVNELHAQQKTVEETQERLASDSDFLDSLHIQLDKFLHAGQPLVDAMGSSLVVVDAETRERLGLLPSPLYMLYTQLLAYNGAASTAAMALTIAGDTAAATLAAAKAAKAAADLEPPSPSAAKRVATADDDDDDDERADSYYAVFPLSVELELFPGPDDAFDAPVKLGFAFFAALNLVGVQVLDGPLPANLLANLFPGDAGETSPNPANAYLGTASGEPFRFAPPLAVASLKPYLWAHSVPLSVGVKAILAQLRNRLNAGRALDCQLSELANGTLPLAKLVSPSFPLQTRVSLRSWRQLSAADADTAIAASPVLTAVADPALQTDVYLAELVRDGATLTATVAITNEYPARPPLFHLELSNSEQAGLSTDNNVGVMAAEVNVYHSELPLPNDNEVLSYQLRKLALCFDVYQECKAASSSSALLSSKLALRTVRGRNREMPFSFDAAVGLFTQRLHRALPRQAPAAMVVE